MFDEVLYTEILAVHIKNVNKSLNFVRVNHHNTHRRQLFYLIQGISDSIKSKRVNKDLLINQIIKLPLNLELLYFLDFFDLLSILEFVTCKQQLKFWSEFGENLAMYVLCCKREESSFMQDMIAATLIACEVSVKDDEKRDKFNAFCNSVAQILYQNISTLNESAIDAINIKSHDDIVHKIFSSVVSLTLFTVGSSVMDAIADETFITSSENSSLYPIYSKLVGIMPSSSTIVLIENILIEDGPMVNWRHLIILVLVLLKKDLKYLKCLISKLLEISLVSSNQELLLAVLIFGKIYSNEPLSGASYLSWFSSTFSSESSRPLNSEKKAQFFLKCLTETLDVVPPFHLKVYIHKAPRVPANCQGALSEFIQQVKARLLSLNESTEIGIYENKTGLSTVENDIQCLLEQIESTGKISQKFLASLTFRKKYYDQSFLPILMASCKKRSSANHILLEKLHKLGKVTTSAFSKHLESCS